MADSVADSTKSEEGENSTDSTEKVSSTEAAGTAPAILVLGYPKPHAKAWGLGYPNTKIASRIGAQVTAAKSKTEPTHRNGAPLIQPSKLGGFRPGFSAFGGSGTNTGAFSSNPFAPRAPLKSDIVSTGSVNPHPHEGLIAPSRFTVNPFMFHDGKSASQSDNDSDADVPGEKKFHLRPSSLSNQVDTLRNKGRASPPTVQSSSILKPATLPDPRQSADSKESPTKASEETGEDKEVSSTSLPVNSPDKPQPAQVAHVTDNGLFSGASGSLTTENSVADSTSKPSAGAEASDFIFGKNLTERVTGVSSSQATSESAAGFVFGQNLADRVVHSAPGSPRSDAETNGKEADKSPTDSGGQTLEESAREYQAKHGVKPDLKEVEIVTGEEEESNVLQANCKLFLFDREKQNWSERGRGVLKLNDMSPSSPAEQFHSRLIMRTQGSLRLILNTKIWPGMMVERASPKSLRITATDGEEGVKVFLITGTPKDSENILRAIDWRVQRLKMCEDKDKSKCDERVSEKRKADSTDAQESPVKRQKKPTVPHQPEGATSNLRREESDSSVQDPETEASCESFSSSFTVRSESD